jgi:hypothetical protein
MNLSDGIDMSPHQVLWNAVSGICVVGDAAFDHRALIGARECEPQFPVVRSPGFSD